MPTATRTGPLETTNDDDLVSEYLPEEESFVVDPFYGDINPGNAAGRALFKQATEGLKSNERIHASIETAKKCRTACEDLASNFGWGDLVNLVPDKGGVRRSILREYKLLTVEDVQKQALTYLTANGTIDVPENMLCVALNPKTSEIDKKKFYQKVRSTMISKAIKGYFNHTTISKLENQSSKYRWIDANGQFFDDGPTMLKLLMDECNPSIRVGVESLKLKIENTRLQQHNNDVSKCMQSIQTNYRLILEAEGTHDNLIRDVFNALLSSNNTNFHNYFNLEKMKWQSGKEYKYEELCKSACDIYTNMKTNGDWTRVDPKDAQIAALTTQVSHLKKNSDGNKYNANKDTRKKGDIDPRRCTKKGDSIVIDGTTYWWCPDHHHPIKFPNGLHMTHKPGAGHEAWKKEKEERNSKRKANKKNQPKDADKNSSSNKTSQQLKLKDNLKSVMMSNYAFSEDMVNSILEDAENNNSDF